MPGDAIEAAARALLVKLDAAQGPLANVCAIAMVHGWPYAGPSFGDEMEALRNAIAAQPAERTAGEMRREVEKP